MRKKKNFTKAKGNYFFDIKMGFNNTVTIRRETKEEALFAYNSYLKQRKDCEWLGKWDGDKFVETNLVSKAA
jgi:hypothetical protein